MGRISHPRRQALSVMQGWETVMGWVREVGEGVGDVLADEGSGVGDALDLDPSEGAHADPPSDRPSSCPSSAPCTLSTSIPSTRSSSQTPSSSISSTWW